MDNEIKEKIDSYIETIKTETDKNAKVHNIKELHLARKLLKNLYKKHKKEISREKIKEIKKAIDMAEKTEDEEGIHFGYIILGVIVLFIWYCQYNQPASIAKSALQYLPETPQELKEQGYQQTLDKCGIEAIKRSNTLLAPAADIVSKNKECDKIILVMQDDRGSCKDNVEIIVDCENSTRFILNENEIISNNSVKSQNEKMSDDLYKYFSDCEVMIKASLVRPATYNMISRDYRITGMATFIDIKFSSKNGIGLPIEAIGHCDFDDEKIVNFNIEQ